MSYTSRREEMFEFIAALGLDVYLYFSWLLQETHPSSRVPHKALYKNILICPDTKLHRKWKPVISTSE